MVMSAFINEIVLSLGGDELFESEIICSDRELRDAMILPCVHASIISSVAS